MNLLSEILVTILDGEHLDQKQKYKLVRKCYDQIFSFLMQIDHMQFSNNGYDKAILNKNLLILKQSLFNQTNFGHIYNKTRKSKSIWGN